MHDGEAGDCFYPWMPCRPDSKRLAPCQGLFYDLFTIELETQIHRHYTTIFHPRGFNSNIYEARIYIRLTCQISGVYFPPIRPSTGNSAVVQIPESGLENWFCCYKSYGIIKTSHQTLHFLSVEWSLPVVLVTAHPQNVVFLACHSRCLCSAYGHYGRNSDFFP